MSKEQVWPTWDTFIEKFKFFLYWLVSAQYLNYYWSLLYAIPLDIILDM